MNRQTSLLKWVGGAAGSTGWGLLSALLILSGFLAARWCHALLGYGLIILGSGVLLVASRSSRPAWWPWLAAGLVPVLVLLAWVLPHP